MTFGEIVWYICSSFEEYKRRERCKEVQVDANFDRKTVKFSEVEWDALRRRLFDEICRDPVAKEATIGETLAIFRIVRSVLERPAS